MVSNQSSDKLSRFSHLSDEQKEQKLAMLLELEPFLLKCLNLNHSINNPLTGILGYGEFMIEDADKLPAEIVDQLTKIMECAERIKEIVDELSEVKSDLANRFDLQELTKSIETESQSSD